MKRNRLQNSKEILADVPRSETTSEAERRLSSLSRLRALVGYDIFLSYARSDGAQYTQALYGQLVEDNFACYYDQLGAPPAATVPPEVLNQVRRCKMLVVIGSPGTQESTAVTSEIRAFLEMGGLEQRTIIVIDVADTVKMACWAHLVEGLVRTLEHKSSLESGIPQQIVRERIRNAAKFRKRNQRLRDALAVASLLLVVAAIAAAGILLEARSAASKAREAERTVRREISIAEQTRDQLQGELSTLEQTRNQMQRELSTLQATLKVARLRAYGRFRLGNISPTVNSNMPGYIYTQLRYTSMNGPGVTPLGWGKDLHSEDVSEDFPWSGTVQIIALHKERHPRDPHRDRYENQLPETKRHSMIEPEHLGQGRGKELALNPDFYEIEVTDCKSALRTIGDLIKDPW